MTTRNSPMTRALVPGALAVLALLWLVGGLALSGASPSRAGKEPLQRWPSSVVFVRYVATSGTDSGDCTASTAPCRSIQYAVDQASAGNVIKVASGVYTGVQGRLAPPGYPAPLAGDVVTQVLYLNRTLSIQGGYTTTNGFAGPPQPARHPTTLDAQGRGRVLFVGGEVSPTLEGLRLTQGFAGGLGGYIVEESIFDGGGGVYVITATLAVNESQVHGNAAAAGGGLYAHHGAVWLNGNRVTANIATGGGGLYLHHSTATLRANTVADNVAHWAGAGLYLESSAATLHGNHVASNTGDFSGGLHLDGSSATLSGNSVVSNTGDAGGGLYLENSAATLRGNVVRANAAQRGGGLFLGFSEAALTNDVVADNQAGEGGGLYLLASSARLQHATLARNGDGSGLHVAQSFYGDPSRAWLTNTIVASHTLGITATAGCTVSLAGTLWDVGANAVKWGGEGTVLAGTLQIDGDPAFVAPEAGDYHVGLASAAVDRGLDAGVETDLDGDPRPLSQGYDIGADEVGLILVKRASPDPVPAGAPLTYTLRLTNASDVDLHATLTDTLPLPIAPGQTALVPGGQITWTAHVTAPRGAWTHAFAVTVAGDYTGPLTNVVRASTQEGASAIYTATTTAFVPRRLYLPFVSRDVQGMTAMVGEYLLVRNPCTTDPCLPGMVYAVSVEGTRHYLTVEGAWLWSNRSWEDYTPQVGDWVAVSGYVDEALDTLGLPFYNIEVLSLKAALSPPAVTGNVVISGVHSHPSYDQYVEIRNSGDQPVALGGWRLHDASGQHTFVFPDYVMSPDQVCRVYTREDHPEWCGFRLGSETTVWDYAQGCAYLRDSAGTLVDARCYCQSHSAHMTLAATASTLQVGETVTVTTTLFNYGCLTLGLPQYRLYVQSDAPGPVFDPGVPEPVMHSLGVDPGESDAAEFVLQAVESGQARLNASSSFEVHLGYPGPAYWGTSGSGSMTLTVTPAWRLGPWR